MTTEAAIRKALDALGTTKDEIRAALKRRRIKGRHAAAQCPLARYLARKGFTWPVVGGGAVLVGTGCRFAFVAMRICQVEFTAAFDRGDYPELVEETKCR